MLALLYKWLWFHRYWPKHILPKQLCTVIPVKPKCLWQFWLQSFLQIVPSEHLSSNPLPQNPKKGQYGQQNTVFDPKFSQASHNLFQSKYLASHMSCISCQYVNMTWYVNIVAAWTSNLSASNKKQRILWAVHFFHLHGDELRSQSTAVNTLPLSD